MANELVANAEFQKIEKEGSDLQVMANAIQVIDDATWTEAGEAFKNIKVRVNQVKALTESPWRSALTAYEEVQEWRKNLIARFTGPEKTLSEKIGAYDIKIAEKRRKEAEAAEAKARAIAEEQRRKEIEAAKKAHDKEAVAALKEAPLVIAPAAPRTQEPTKVQGVSSRFEWKLDVIFSPQSVPREYCEPSEKIIKERIKRLGGAHGIPGVRAIQVPIVSGRV